MKVLSVTGITKSGKTTIVESIIRELVKRGFTVGSVKEIHYEAFRIDGDGTNTDRHRQAGSKLVTARGFYETDVLFPAMLPMEKILSFYTQDYVILEGVRDINAPMIVAAHNTAEIDERLDYRTLCVSGVIANDLHAYRDLPVINCLTEAERLAGLIVEKVPELVPDYDPDCCSACGTDCHNLLQKILAGEAKRGDCVLGRGDVRLSIGGKEIEMVPFVKKLLKNAVIGVAGELNGYKKGAEIVITIGEEK
jgi:molybdopterin-guanine dinucleotide biosynthesis protein B